MHAKRFGSRREFLKVSAVAVSALFSTACASLPEPTGLLASVTGQESGNETAASVPTPRPSPTSASTPMPDASPTPEGPQVLVVANTGGDGAYIRRTIKPDQKIKAWPDGTKMVAVGPERTVEGRVWSNIRDPDGNVGWMPSEYLKAVTTAQPRATASTPAATPTRPPSTPTVARAGSTAVPSGQNGKTAADSVKWNTQDVRASTNGNISLAIKVLKSMAPEDLKSKAVSIAGSSVATTPWKFYGSVVAIRGPVTLVQGYPSGNLAAKLFGGEDTELGEVVLGGAGSAITYVHVGSLGGLAPGGDVVVYGLPVGLTEASTRPGGPAGELVVVGKLVEKL